MTWNFRQCLQCSFQDNLISSKMNHFESGPAKGIGHCQVADTIKALMRAQHHKALNCYTIFSGWQRKDLPLLAGPHRGFTAFWWALENF